MIIYLAQSYTKDPESAIKLAYTIVDRLNEKGFTVFSPIQYWHPMAMFLKEKHNIVINHDVYVARDIKILASLKDPVVAFTTDCFNYPHDAKITNIFEHNANDFLKLIQELEDVFFTHEMLKFPKHWQSIGAFNEYLYAHQHYIPCCLINNFLFAKNAEATENAYEHRKISFFK
jgi:hypothetical protein